MKSPVIKRLLPLALALCLTCGSGLNVSATEASAAAQTEETQTTEENADGAVAQENTQTATQETTSTGTSGSTTTSGSTSTGGSSTTSGSSTNSTNVKVTPSNANALLLMDAGAQSPKAVPGQEVEVVLTLAVNREYLPSEKYVLRNITIQPDIPKESTKDTWPFDIIDASKVRHLDDMSYNSTAEVWYKFSVSQFAKEGVYPINFKVNATVWRQDSVNGTDITEDVEFALKVFLTVTDNGDMSGVVSNIGPLNVAGRENTAISSPTGSPGETIVMSMPIVNKGGTLENVTVSPVVTGDLETFPFVAQDINYGRELGRMENGTRQQVDWIFTISPYATTGNKIVTFRATYEENGVYGECTFTGYIYVKNGYTQNTAASLMVENYTMYVNDNQVDNLEAGNDAVLKVTLKNNAAKNAVYKTVATLKLADSTSLILSPGYADAAYVRSIPAGQTAEIEYHISARASAAVGPSTATIGLTYEISEKDGAVAGSATSTIQIPIKQQMDLQIDTPVVYGTPVQDEPLAVSLNIVNLGRSRAYNVRVVGMDGIYLQDSYFGGDILAAGTLNADFQVIPNKSGNYTGTIVVQYEDADGEQYTQSVDLPLDAADADAISTEALSTDVETNKKSGSHLWVWILILLILILAAVVGWYLLIYKKKQQTAEIEAEDGEAAEQSDGYEEE
ncbi:hypothetical protein DW725_02685 [Clostridiaceae bacterium AM27-36LB]|nr:hypothetical protein DW644_00520 [Clostridiales bacterium AM23-16LB]RHT85581.1 hypothetical protein DW725_02685 [Clostridiaceae bacterium AM27-36LB]RHW02779.1 hypothetical protein DXA90_10340 [Clostridiaceae bacterium OF09-1]